MQVNSQGIDQHMLAVSLGVPPIKRKRGRPPKSKQVFSDNNSTSLTVTHDDLRTNDDVPLKRKRGRPRKSKPLFSGSSDSNSTSLIVKHDALLPASDDIPLKRKRGRPRKSKPVFSGSSDSNSTSLIVKHDALLPASDDIPLKRKRGRPRKSKPVFSGSSDSNSTSLIVTHDALLPSSDDIPLKRKRGRPRKTKPVFSGSLDSNALLQRNDDILLKRKRGRPRKTGESLKQATRVEETETQTSSVSVGSLDAECKESKTKEKPVKRPTSSKLHSKKRNPKRYRTKEEVHQLLERCGVSDLDKVCKCLKAGIMNGHIHLVPSDEDPSGVHGLDQVIAKGVCNVCSGKVKATLRQLLYQGDIGWDYEDGSPDAKVFCTNDCGGMYVGGFCNGKVHMDGGKFYNHCIECPDFGVCIYDYRNIHCTTCGNHYFCSIFDEPFCPDCACSSDSDKQESIDLAIVPLLRAALRQ